MSGINIFSISIPPFYPFTVGLQFQYLRERSSNPRSGNMATKLRRRDYIATWLRHSRVACMAAGHVKL